jgi:hypothetical protein
MEPIIVRPAQSARAERRRGVRLIQRHAGFDLGAGERNAVQRQGQVSDLIFFNEKGIFLALGMELPECPPHEPSYLALVHHLGAGWVSLRF